jgi:Fic family protein
MSSLILKHRNAYYQLLNAISGQAQSLDLTQWITWNSNIAVEAKQQAIRVYEKRVRLMHFMKQLDPSVFNSRQFFMLFKLADRTFEGKLTTDKWAKMNKCSPAAAIRDIQHLLQVGLLVPSGDTGPKAGYFLNPSVMERLL